MVDGDESHGRGSPRVSRRGWVAAAVEGAVHKVGDRVGGQVGTASRSVVDELEPYLSEQTVPRVVDALVPHLVERVVPEVLDGVTDHVATVTVPSVMAGATPQLVDELLPHILDRLQPYLAEELVPALLAELTPRLVEQTVPAVIEGVLPMVRSDVVPAILDDIVDDPKVRVLIREQSQGLVIDALERGRRALAQGDDFVERVIRRVRRAGPAPLEDPSVLPPGRTRSHAGAVTRGVALAVDLALVAFVAAQGLTAVLAIVGSVVDPVPGWFVAGATVVSVSLAPLYFAIAWWLVRRTLGAGLAGFVVCAEDGSTLRPPRALVRAVVGLLAMPVWALGLLRSGVDQQRRGWLDLVTGTRTPYAVHEEVSPP